MFILTHQTCTQPQPPPPPPQSLCNMPPQHQDNINHSSASAIIIKGKRTKRPRSNDSPSSNSNPPPLDYNSSSTWSGDEENDVNQDQEEEDMANCLIMLAQGNGNPFDSQPNNGNSSKFSQIATTTNKAAFFVYHCKTCNRSFPSFQALGGHRASHKKPKTGEHKTNVVEETEIASAPTTLALQITTLNNNKGKVHECSICGSEFSSGQALGGHMRRHRAAMMANQSTHLDIKHRNLLSLDLNLPAPEDDHHLHTSPKFQFRGSPPSTPLVFSTPALVDCHY